ncbi:MAG: hypothetical protein NZ805_16130, partial [Armatimonadetes bacterium]|nr:hypothetical protein [Armatimonadota bacterium]
MNNMHPKRCRDRRKPVRKKNLRADFVCPYKNCRDRRKPVRKSRTGQISATIFQRHNLGKGVKFGMANELRRIVYDTSDVPHPT